MSTTKEAKHVRMQYSRDGKPIVNPSVNSLSGFAYFYTKGIDDKPRVSVARLEKILKGLGVTDPRSEAFEVALPNGVVIAGTPTEGDAPKAAKKATAVEDPAAVAAAKEAAAKTKLARIDEMKAEGTKVKAWKDGGEVGPRPETPVTDKRTAELEAKKPNKVAATVKGKAAEKAAVKATKVPAKKATSATGKRAHAAKKAPARRVAPKRNTTPIPKSTTARRAARQAS